MFGRKKSPTKEKVLEILRRIIDPATGKDLVSAGMIDDVDCQKNVLQITVQLPPARAKDAEMFRHQIENLLGQKFHTPPPRIIFTAHRAASSAPSLSKRPSHFERAMAKPMDLPPAKFIIAVASGKGGVGKSTLAVNLAAALQKIGKKVGIMDADIYGPSLPKLLGIQQKPEHDGQKMIPLSAHGLSAISIGFLMDPEAAAIWRGPMVITAVTQLLGDVAWPEMDVLIIDMPPGTGDAALTISQKVPLAGAVIVSTPQDLALIDARKGIAMFEKVNVPILGVVENMSFYQCPHCGERSEIFGTGGARDEAMKRNVPFLGEIPLHLSIREMADRGTPLVTSDPESPYAQNFLSIAEKLWQQLTQNEEQKKRHG